MLEPAASCGEMTNVSSERPPLERKLERRINSQTSSVAGAEVCGGGSTPLDCYVFDCGSSLLVRVVLKKALAVRNPTHEDPKPAHHNASTPPCHCKREDVCAVRKHIGPVVPCRLR